MWRIEITYTDGSRMGIQGRDHDIPLPLAREYYKGFVAGRDRKAVFQKYPVKKNPPMTLEEKIRELEYLEFKKQVLWGDGRGGGL